MGELWLTAGKDQASVFERAAAIDNARFAASRFRFITVPSADSTTTSDAKVKGIRRRKSQRHEVKNVNSISFAAFQADVRNKSIQDCSILYGSQSNTLGLRRSENASRCIRLSQGLDWARQSIDRIAPNDALELWLRTQRANGFLRQMCHWFSHVVVFSGTTVKDVATKLIDWVCTCLNCSITKPRARVILVCSDGQQTVTENQFWSACRGDSRLESVIGSKTSVQAIISECFADYVIECVPSVTSVRAPPGNRRSTRNGGSWSGRELRWLLRLASDHFSRGPDTPFNPAVAWIKLRSKTNQPTRILHDPEEYHRRHHWLQLMGLYLARECFRYGETPLEPGHVAGHLISGSETPAQASIVKLAEGHLDSMSQRAASSRAQPSVAHYFLQQLRQVRAKLETHRKLNCVFCWFRPARHFPQCDHGVCDSCCRIFGTPLLELNQYCFDRCEICTQPFPLNITLEPLTGGHRVAVLEGGGIRGVVQIAILKAIESNTGISVSRQWTRIYGRSAGAIIGTAIGRGFTLSQCHDLFVNLAEGIFSSRLPQWLAILTKRSLYSVGPIQKAFAVAFGANTPLLGFDPKLVNQSTTQTTILTARVADGKTALLSNFVANDEPTSSNYYRPQQQRDAQNCSVVESLLATSAAPIYWPVASIASEKFHDGVLGEFSCSGSMIEEEIRIEDNGSTPIDLVCSFGCGSYDCLPCTADYWLPRIIDTCARMLSEDRQYRVLPPRMNGIRLNPSLRMPEPSLNDIQGMRDIILYLQQFSEAIETQELSSVCFSLLATTFFFEPDQYELPISRDGIYTIKGRIFNRVIADPACNILPYLHHIFLTYNNCYTSIDIANLSSGIPINLTSETLDTELSVKLERRLQNPKILDSESITGFPQTIFQLVGHFRGYVDTKGSTFSSKQPKKRKQTYISRFTKRLKLIRD